MYVLQIFQLVSITQSLLEWFIINCKLYSYYQIAIWIDTYHQIIGIGTVQKLLRLRDIEKLLGGVCLPKLWIGCLLFIYYILFYKCLQRFSLLILPTGTAQMTAILTKPSWSLKLSNGVVIVMENQT